MLNNFKEDLERYKKTVREQEIYEFGAAIQQLLTHSKIFKPIPNEEYNVDKLCVVGMEDLTAKLYNINNPRESIFQLTRNDYCEVKVLKYVMENIDEFWKYIYGLDSYYKKVLTTNANCCVYRGNLKDDSLALARDLYSELNTKFSKDEAGKFIAGTLSEKEILNIKKRTLNFLKANYPVCRKIVVDSRVNILVNGAKFLDRYGYIEYYTIKNNARARMLHMPYLQTNIRTSKKEKPLTCVSDYFDSDILSSLPDEELSALSLFMINRVEKVKTLIIRTLAMITFLSDKTKNDIDNAGWIYANQIPKKEIIEAVARYKMLADYLKEQRHVLNEKNNNHATSPEYINNNNLSYREFDLGADIPRQFIDDYNAEYNRFDGDNMLIEDLKRLVHADNFQIFYEYKDGLIDILLNSIISARININWGIVSNDGVGFVDDNDQIILSFDLPGYNAPISCHANLDKVIKTVVNLTNDTIIPLYLGNNQLVYEDNFTNKYYSTYIPFKLSKEQKDAVKEDSINSEKSIAKHIAMMQNVLSTARLKREENRFVDLLSFTEETKINPSVKSHK